MTHDQKFLREQLQYNPETGVFTRLTGFRRGRVAGGKSSSNGRWTISVGTKRYLASRLAWVWMTGKFPVNEIDHINRNPLDNRFCNLREATRSQNDLNKIRKPKTGSRNIYPHLRHFRVALYKNGKQLRFGTYKTLAEAEAVRDAAVALHYGEFAP